MKGVPVALFIINFIFLQQFLWFAVLSQTSETEIKTMWISLSLFGFILSQSLNFLTGNKEKFLIQKGFREQPPALINGIKWAEQAKFAP